jgi:hypothetical protein
LAGLHARYRGLRQLAQRAFGAFGGTAQIDRRQGVAARINAGLTLEQLGDMIDDAIVPVLASQPNVALNGDGLK